MIIATGADDRFAMPMAVALCSALAHTTERAVTILIVDGGVAPENRRRVEGTITGTSTAATVEWIDADRRSLDGLGVTPSFSQAAYLRLLVPDLLHDRTDRVIYLDSDLVVLRDLSDLWRADLCEHVALAVPDYSYPNLAHVDWAGTTYYDSDPDRPYCNTGVVVMNLPRWRERHISERAIEYMQRHPRWVRWADQDGINAVIGNGWGVLDDRWNVMLAGINSYGRRSIRSLSERRNAQRQLLQHPWVLHYTGPIKPWRFPHKTESTRRFFEQLQRTGWYGRVDRLDELMSHTWRLHAADNVWAQRLAASANELEALIPPGADLIVIDEAEWPDGLLEGRHTRPFLEANGRYAGIPADDATALYEFDRLRQDGAAFAVCAEGAFWWLEHFPRFSRQLRSFICLAQNDRFVAFDLRRRR